MPITTTGELRDAVDEYAKRTLTTNQFNHFLDLCEGHIYYGNEDLEFGNEPLRVTAMVTSTDLTISSGQASKPTSFIEAIRMYIASGGANQEITYYAPTDFWGRYLSQDVGIPEAFTIEGDNFEFGSGASGTPKLLYYQTLDALDPADTSSTNAILTTNPNVYLWGVLAEMAQHFEEHDRLANYLRRFRSAIGGWNASDRRTQTVGPLLSRPVAIA